MLRALGKSPTEAEIKAIVKDIDPDNRGVVDYKEFEKIMTRDIREYDNEQDLKAAWKVRVRVWGTPRAEAGAARPAHPQAYRLLIAHASSVTGAMDGRL